MSIVRKRQLANEVTKCLPALPHGRSDIGARVEEQTICPLGGYGVSLGPIRWRLWLRWIF